MTKMENLFTVIQPDDFRPKMTYQDGILMAGSCFAEHISRKLNRYKYNTCVNPLGILFNPASLARSFERIRTKEYYRNDELVFAHDLYHSMDHHGSFSGRDPDEVLNKINSTIEQASAHLIKSKFVFVSLGTCRVYRYKESGKIAGNCHKIPQASFDETMLTVTECQTELAKIYQAIKAASPDAHVIWTVSPVRHLKDGLIQNQRSKSTLIIAIANFITENPDSGYFEAYELMMDQMRDYRFYADDMIHPSDAAIDIIWDHFSQTYIDPHEAAYHPAIEKIRRAMGHRFLHENEPAQKTFAEMQLRHIQQLSDQFPEMDWKNERQHFFHLIEPD